jgi:DNA-binding NarL/FixJ family response regulator
MTSGATAGHVANTNSSKVSVCVVAAFGLIPQVRRVLAADPMITFTQCSGDVDDAVKLAQKLAPSVLILGENSVPDLKPNTVSTLFKKGVRTLLALSNSNERQVTDLLRMGHSGVLVLPAKARTLKKAIRVVASGEIWGSRRVLAELIREHMLLDVTQELTPREAEILTLIGQGHKNKEIAEHLFVTHDTIRWHERRLYSKLGVHGRNDLVGRAFGSC